MQPLASRFEITPAIRYGAIEVDMAVRRIALHTQAVSLPWAYLKYWTDGLTDVMSHLFPP